MSKRVYEIAREKSLDSKEVIKRLREAGVEVNHHSATIEDPVYERVFGDGQNGQPNAEATPTEPAGAAVEDAQNGRPEASAVSTPGAPVEQKEPVTEARRSGRRRRRVVIDASATTRGASRTAATPAAAREEPKAAPVEEPVGETANKTAVRIEPGATVKDLADALGIAPAQVVKVLFSLGEMKTVTQTLSTDEIELVAAEMGVEVEIGAIEEPALEEVLPEDAAEDLVEKPPVVTVMGHVDHGKTSLLDRIRQANVQSGEAGGITQHIGAYQVESGGRKLTFIDTPGHEAFTEMRARGAKVTNVVILVVAADDGVMPQTDEAIEHARAAEVPLVVALNKIDVPNANPDRVYAELSERELVPEAYGGDTVTVPVSAKTGEGIDELLENVLIVAELEDLKANPNAPASGYVVESERDPGRGPVATLLVNRGTLHRGDTVLAGTAYGRVRAMLDYTGQRIKEAGPGDPVEILGLSGVPEAGTRFEATDHERNARDKAHQAEAALRRQELAEGGPRRTLEELLGEGSVQDLNLVVKADVAGSVEALKEALARLSTDEVRVNIVRSGVGAVTDSDVMLGSASGGIVLGFNVRPTNTAKQVAEREGVGIRTYDVIYEGNIASLRRFKDDVRSVRQGFECGIGVENFNDIKEGDVLEFFEIVEVPR